MSKRKPTYELTQALANSICDEIANGSSLRSICQADGLPSVGTVCRWLAENADFAEQYARAREAQAEFYADEIVSISDGGEEADPTRDRLRVDARKWVASKLLPKKYGDRAELNVSGTIDVRQWLQKLGEPD